MKCLNQPHLFPGALLHKLWNALPLSLRYSESVDSFKNQLKTFLFKQAFIYTVVDLPMSQPTYYLFLSCYSILRLLCFYNNLCFIGGVFL